MRFTEVEERLETRRLVMLLHAVIHVRNDEGLNTRKKEESVKYRCK